jgi:hypothetical protein
MKKFSLFLARLLLGLFFGRFYRVYQAPPPDPALSVHVPDNDERFDPCDGGVAKMNPLYP